MMICYDTVIPHTILLSKEDIKTSGFQKILNLLKIIFPIHCFAFLSHRFDVYQKTLFS